MGKGETNKRLGVEVGVRGEGGGGRREEGVLWGRSNWSSSSEQNLNRCNGQWRSSAAVGSIFPQENRFSEE